MFKTNLELFGRNAENKEDEKVAIVSGEGAGGTVDYKALYEAALKAKEEAEAAKALAEDNLNKLNGNSDNEEVESIEDFLNQRVPIMLYKDGEKYKDDVVLAINGEKIQIQRGKQVYIPRKYMHLLENQYRQQMVAADLQTELADDFANASKERGITL